MTQFELYTLVLCLIVFVILVSLFFVLFTCLIKTTLELIRCGMRDERIIKEYLSECKKKKKRFSIGNVILVAFSAAVCILLAAVFAFSLLLNITESKYAASGIPSLKVVQSGSMSEKHEDNRYLTENGLHDQFQMFDLILSNPLPAAEELKLYDIVLYERKGDLIIHRIVEIEAPNEKHPNEWYFKTRGDANKYADEYPVTYSMMRAVYRGERIPFVGSFIMFMQSPAGWLCFLLVLFAMIITPIIERKLAGARDARLALYFHKGAPTQGCEKVSVSILPLRRAHFYAGLALRTDQPRLTIEMSHEQGPLCLCKNDKDLKKK